MWTSLLSDGTQRVISQLFYKFGVFAFRRWWICLLLGFLITCLSCLGFGNYEYENRAAYLWVPQSSEVFKNYKQTIDHFGEIEAEMVLVIHNAQGNNLLTPDSMDALYQVFNVAMNVTYFSHEKVWTFDDLCARQYDEYPNCYSRESGFFSLFDFDPDNWATQEAIQSVIDKHMSVLEIYVGDYIYNENVVIGGEYVRLVLTLAGYSNDTLVEIAESYQNEWEDYWKSNKKRFLYEFDFELTFLTDNSFGPEIDRVVDGDIPILGAAFLVMLLYLSLTLGRCNCVDARPLAALASLVSTICAIGTGMGLALAFGVEFNAIVLLSPFVLLGVAVDDDIIIVEALERTDRSKDLATRFGCAMEHAGVSITLTSLSSIIAFLIGSTVDLPAIHAFCLVAALSFLANYMSQLLVFVPLLTWDERRRVQNRNFCLCCLIHSKPRTSSNSTPSRANASQTGTKPTADAPGEGAKSWTSQTSQTSQTSTHTSEMSSTRPIALKTGGSPNKTSHKANKSIAGRVLKRAPSRSMTVATTTFTTEVDLDARHRQLKSISMVSDRDDTEITTNDLNESAGRIVSPPMHALGALDEAEESNENDQDEQKSQQNEAKVEKIDKIGKKDGNRSIVGSYDINPAFTPKIAIIPKHAKKPISTQITANESNETNVTIESNDANNARQDGQESEQSVGSQTGRDRENSPSASAATVGTTDGADGADSADLHAMEAMEAQGVEDELKPQNEENDPKLEKSDEKEDLERLGRMCSVEWVVLEVLVSWLSSRKFRMGVFAVFAVLFGVSCFALQFVSTDSDATKLVPDDSFIIDMFDALDDGFGDVSIGPVEIVVQSRDFSVAQQRDEVWDMIDVYENEFDSKYGMFVGNISHWMGEFEDWLQNTQGVQVADLAQDEYYAQLKLFTQDEEHRQWHDLIVYDNDELPTRVDATKFSATAEYALSLSDRWEWHKELDKVLEDELGSGKNGYVFILSFLFSYFATIIVDLTVENLTFAVVGVFVVLLLLVDMRMAVFIVIVMVMIDVEVVAWMVANNITLDYLSYSELVMAVGLTVDYIVHVTYAISHAKLEKEEESLNDYRDSYKERLTVAFKDMGVGVAKGALTTFLGTMTLVFSQSEAFRVFFVMICGIVLISVLHGFLLIPALLAEMPFIYSKQCKY